MTTAAIYVRVSTSQQEEEGTSLTTQEQRCRQYAAEHGYTVDEEHVYREVYSGIELWERPHLTSLRAAVRRKAIGVVIAFAIDRLARDPVHLGVVISEAEHAGAAVEFVTEPLDNSPEGQLIRFVRGYAAKVEHMKIKERSMRGKRARVEAGKVPNQGVELYGYRRDKLAGTRSIYEPEAAAVRRMFTWIGAEGMPIREVIRRLNTEGVPSPSIGKVAYPDPSRRPYWGKGQLNRILGNPAYKGEPIAWRWQSGSKLRPPSEWVRLPASTTPAIVSPELWAAAAARLAVNRGQDTRNEARPYLLRGLVVCALCGRAMRATPEHNRRVYRCSSRETPSGPCGASRVPGDDAEAWAWD